MNFDTLVECSALSMGIGTRYIPEDVFFLEDDQAYDQKIPLLKLHGSVNWFNNKDMVLRTIVRPVVTDNYSGSATNPGKNQHILIIGGQNKVKVQDPYLSLLVEFKKQLQQIEELFVIGYSFRDPHINYFIRRWLAEGKWQHKPTQLYVYDYDEYIESKVKQLIPESHGNLLCRHTEASAVMQYLSQDYRESDNG